MWKNNKNKILDEIESMQSALDKAAATPDQAFKMRLQEELLQIQEVNPVHFTFFNFATMQTLRSKLLLLGTGAVSFLAIIAVAVIVFNRQSSLSPADISADEIFAGMAASNKPEANTFQGLSAESDQKMASTLIAPMKEDTYTFSKTLTVAGPRQTACINFLPYSTKQSISEYHSYYNEEQGYLHKSVSFDENGVKYYYSLSDGEYTYEYYGGQFGLRSKAGNFMIFETGDAATLKSETSTLVAEDPKTLPADDPVVDEPVSIEDQFGPDAKILGQEEINGQTYYVTSWSYDLYCDSGETQKAFVKTWVKKGSFEYYKEETYLDSIEANNLVVTNSYENSEQVIDYANVQNNFTFDLGVTLRDVDYESNQQGSESYNNAFRNLMNSEKLTLLDPSDKAFVLNSFYSDKVELPNPDAVRMERGLYAAGTIGDKMYTEALEIYKPYESGDAFLSVGYGKETANKYLSFGYDVYANSLSETELKEKFAYDSKVTSEQIKLKLNGSEVNATLYTVTYEGVSEPGNTGEEETRPAPDFKAESNYAVIVELGNFQYLLRFDGGFSKDAVVNFTITSIEQSDSTEYNKYLENLFKTSSTQSEIAF